jgi:predicted amidohydrolase YtcJ
MNKLSVIPSMQPYHAIDDGRWAEKRIGQERIKTTYPFKSLFDANARVTFGSDSPVAPMNVMQGIYAAVTRRTIDGANPNGWVPSEKISVEQALKAYTVNNAFAGFQENKLGQLKKDFLADLVVLEQDILSIPANQIKDVKVHMTVVDGIIVYEKK